MHDFLTPQSYFRSRQGKPRKRFGQHFLAQPATAERIVEAACLEPSEVVVEVGPGLGILTRLIMHRVGRLHLVEVDRELAAYLQTRSFPPECSVSVHRQDILELDFKSLSRQEGSGLVVIGNLPYNISSPLFFHLMDSADALRRGIFMVQKEVGQRLAAPPGSKDYGVLSVLMSVHAAVTPLFRVGPKQFHPPPKVDSLVVRLDFREAPLLRGVSWRFLRRVVKTAFQQRRKTLYNSLKPLAGKDQSSLGEAFDEAGINPRRRPETLWLEEFLRLAEALQLKWKPEQLERKDEFKEE